MKKRCTNSSCRRTFSYHVPYGKTISCPFCGRKYARLGRKESEYMVYNRITGELQDLSAIEEFRREGKKVFAIKYLYKDLKWGSLKECKTIIDRIWLTGNYPRSYGIDRNCNLFVAW